MQDGWWCVIIIVHDDSQHHLSFINISQHLTMFTGTSGTSWIEGRPWQQGRESESLVQEEKKTKHLHQWSGCLRTASPSAGSWWLDWSGWPPRGSWWEGRQRLAWQPGYTRTQGRWGIGVFPATRRSNMVLFASATVKTCLSVQGVTGPHGPTGPPGSPGLSVSDAPVEWLYKQLLGF